MGSPQPARRVDTREDSAHHHDVGECRHANALREATTGRITALRMLRYQCSHSAEGVGRPCMRLWLAGTPSRLPAPHHRCHPRSASGCQHGATSASSSGRSKSDSCSRCATCGSVGYAAACTHLGKQWRPQENDRAALCRFNGNELWEVAAAVAVDACDASARWRRQSNARGTRNRLQHAQCIHCRVPKGARFHTGSILQGCFGQLILLET